MKRFLLASFIVLTFVFYSILDRLSVTRKPTANLISAPNLSPQPSPASAMTATGIYKDGQYTGNAEDAFYGIVQVKAIISGGVISDVQFLSYPRDRSHSVEINTYAMPILTSEAIQAQSANVNIVSGATATSQAFIQSLQTALTSAKG